MLFYTIQTNRKQNQSDNNTLRQIIKQLILISNDPQSNTLDDKLQEVVLLHIKEFLKASISRRETENHHATLKLTTIQRSYLNRGCDIFDYLIDCDIIY